MSKTTDKIQEDIRLWNSNYSDMADMLAKHGRHSPQAATAAMRLFAPYRAYQLEDGSIQFPVDERSPQWMLPFDNYFVPKDIGE